MIQTCDCGKEFLTETDTHVVIPSKNYKTNCGCHLTNGINRAKFDLINENTHLKKELDKLRKQVEYLEGFIKFCSCGNPVEDCICVDTI